MMKPAVLLLCLVSQPAWADAQPEWSKLFREQVARCWNIGALENPVDVQIEVRFDAQGRADALDISLKSNGAGTQEQIQTSFKAAKRAVLRCMPKSGYALPRAAYSRWKTTVLTFAPVQMKVLK